jgi:hypothetical protein
MNRFFRFMGNYPLFGEQVGVMDAKELGVASIKGSIQLHASASTIGQINAATHAQHAGTEAAHLRVQVFSSLG